MRRTVLALMAVCVVATCFLAAAPPSALAGTTWKVSNTHGQVVAYCDLDGGFFTVYQGPKYLGSIDYADFGYWAVDPSDNYVCQLLKVKGAAVWLAYNEAMTPQTRGKAVGSGAYWLLKKRTSSGSFVTLGRVPRACPGQLAAAALWFLWLD
jgi:hypothetical protein